MEPDPLIGSRLSLDSRGRFVDPGERDLIRRLYNGKLVIGCARLQNSSSEKDGPFGEGVYH